MPLSKSAIENMLLKMQKARETPQHAPDPLERLLAKIELLKGETGPPGPQGDPGRTPVKYVDYFTDKEIAYLLKMATPKKGVDYFDGERGATGADSTVPGPAGEDGEDGVANMEEVSSMCDEKVKKHEDTFNHDPFLLGTKKVDESGLQKGMVYQYNGEKFVPVELPKVQQQKIARGVSSTTNARYTIKTITTSQTLDPLDQIILIDASSGNVTLTLYATAGNLGSHHYIKRIDTSANTVSFAMTGSDTLDAETVYQLVNFGSGTEIFGDGVTSWYVKHS